MFVCFCFGEFLFFLFFFVKSSPFGVDEPRLAVSFDVHDDCTRARAQKERTLTPSGTKCRARSTNDMQTTPAYEQADHEDNIVMGHQHEHCELNLDSFYAKTLPLMPVWLLLLNTLAVLTRG